MTPKWTIRKYDGFLRWKVFAPGTEPPKTAFAQQLGFLTFPDALTYVEAQIRKARTVEVELPKVEKSKCINPDMSPAMFVAKTPGNYGIFLGHRHMLTATAEELKPLGEYLLALHYEKETK